MRIIKRVPTKREQDNTEWRSQDKWSREVIRELARLGYDNPSNINPDADDEPGRAYFTNVGRAGFTVVVRIEQGTAKILRVAVGKESMTARQAALWMRKRSSRERRYLP